MVHKADSPFRICLGIISRIVIFSVAKLIQSPTPLRVTGTVLIFNFYIINCILDALSQRNDTNCTSDI
jgi:hypothetical protein